MYTSRVLISLEPTGEEINAVFVEFGGETREAIQALMHEFAVLADVSSAISSNDAGAE